MRLLEFAENPSEFVGYGKSVTCWKSHRMYEKCHRMLEGFYSTLGGCRGWLKGYQGLLESWHNWKCHRIMEEMREAVE